MPYLLGRVLRERSSGIAAFLLGLGSLLATMATLAQQPRMVEAYKTEYAERILERSVFYGPRHGGVYRAKFEAQVRKDPNVRGVVIHNHGCGGMWGWETHVAQFYYRRGFAVITPEFIARPHNRTGCPGSGNDDALRGGGKNFREGVFTARNPARLDARVDDTLAVVRYVKSLTDKPILLSGHSEGARTAYHWPYVDPQIVGAILHNQSCSAAYEHLWQLAPTIPTWQVLERSDPWAPSAASGGCGHHFANGHEGNFTLLMQDGNNHNPLNNKEAQDSLDQWLKRIVPGAGVSVETHNEHLLDAIQRRIYPEAFTPAAETRENR